MASTIKRWIQRARSQLRRVARSQNPKPRRPLTPSDRQLKLRFRRQKYHQEQSPFFKLPGELRREIYKHIYGGPMEHTRGQRASGHRLALLKTCCKVYTEAIEILYNCYSLTYYSTYGILFTPLPRHPTRKKNIQNLQINVEFSLSCCQWCDRLDLFDGLHWEWFARDLATDMPGARNLCITMVNKSNRTGFHGDILDDFYFTDLLNRLVVPHWDSLDFLEKFEVEVNWEMERPRGAALTAFRVLKD